MYVFSVSNRLHLNRVLFLSWSAALAQREQTTATSLIWGVNLFQRSEEEGNSIERSHSSFFSLFYQERGIVYCLWIQNWNHIDRVILKKQCQGQIRNLVQACDLDITCRIHVLCLNSLTSKSVRNHHISIRLALEQELFSLFVFLFHPYVFKDTKWHMDYKCNVLFTLHTWYSSYSFIL